MKILKLATDEFLVTEEYRKQTPALLQELSVKNEKDIL